MTPSNPKSESRNPKQSQEIPKSEARPGKACFLFELLGFVSDFDIRISSLFQPLRRFGRVISQNHVRSSAFDAGEDFKGDALLVDPAFLGRRLDHGEFARDV